MQDKENKDKFAGKLYQKFSKLKYYINFIFAVNFQNHPNKMAKIKLDLHEIYNRGRDIDRALKDIMEEAIENRIETVEIIPGKGSGQLKKKVLRFLQQPEIKKLYHRIEKDGKNFGRVFVYFRF